VPRVSIRLLQADNLQRKSWCTSENIPTRLYNDDFTVRTVSETLCSACLSFKSTTRHCRRRLQSFFDHWSAVATRATPARSNFLRWRAVVQWTFRLSEGDILTPKIVDSVTAYMLWLYLAPGEGSVHTTRVHGPCSRVPVRITREHGSWTWVVCTEPKRERKKYLPSTVYSTDLPDKAKAQLAGHS